MPRHFTSLLIVALISCCSSSDLVVAQSSSSLQNSQFERGEPNDLVDVVANVVSIPSKLLFWNRRVDNHCVSLETEGELRNYLATNELNETKVRLNQYAPIQEWKRLAKNDTVPALMRYTFGTLHNLRYTLVPGRIFGGDHYNPYTNTLSVYSDVPAFAMAEAAYAKDIRARRHPGWYTFGQELPVLGMMHESIATDDVLDYVAMQGNVEQHRAAYKTLLPRYGAAWGGTIGDLVADGTGIGKVAGGVVGHIAGRKRANEVQQVSYESTLTVRGQAPGDKSVAKGRSNVQNYE